MAPALSVLANLGLALQCILDKSATGGEHIGVSTTDLDRCVMSRSDKALLARRWVPDPDDLDPFCG